MSQLERRIGSLMHKSQVLKTEQDYVLWVREWKQSLHALVDITMHMKAEICRLRQALREGIANNIPAGHTDILRYYQSRRARIANTITLLIAARFINKSRLKGGEFPPEKVEEVENAQV